MDNIVEKVDHFKGGLQQLISQLDDIKADAVRANQEHTATLAASLQRCEQLEREAREKPLTPSPIITPSLNKNKITEFRISLNHNSARTVHLNLSYSLYNNRLEMKDIIESNENFFTQISSLEQDNQRLKQETENLNQVSSSSNNNSLASHQYTDQPSVVSSSLLQGNLGQIREVKYKIGWGWGGEEKTVHLNLERAFYGNSLQSAELIESNENFFRQYNSLQQENTRLTQMINQLNREKSSLEQSVLASQGEVTQLKSALQQQDQQRNLLESNARQILQTVQSLESQLTAKNEEVDRVKRDNNTHLTAIKNLEEEKRSLQGRLNETDTFSKGLSSSLDDQKKTTETLKKQIGGGTVYVTELQTTLKQREKEISGFKLELAALNSELQEKEQLLKKSVPLSKVDNLMSQGIEKLKMTEKERAEAIAKHESYKARVLNLLSSANIDQELLEKVNDL